MESSPVVKHRFMHHICTIISILGFIIMLIGFGLDLIPGSSPGISFPQLMIIISGLLLLIGGWFFKQIINRPHITQNLAKNLLISFIVILITLVVLEIGLTLANIKTRYPTLIPETFLEAVPWWICDEAGCHYDYENMLVACQNKEVSGRRCMINRQGFHSSQDFTMRDEFTDKLRVLMLGDSFTFGGAAKIGNSFVETLEAQFSDAIIWNTGIPGAGTVQALATLETYAPILQPQIAILGFYMNDFEDNVFPVDSYFMGVDETKYPLAIRQYMLDNLGQVSQLNNQSDLYYRYHQIDPPISELQRTIGTTRLGSLTLNTFDAISRTIYKIDDKRIKKQVEVTREYLIELRDYTNTNDIALIVLLIPRREDIGSPGTLMQHAIQIFEELKIPYLNVMDTLSVDIDYAPIPDIHWSSEGHHAIGLLLSECLEQFQNHNIVSNCQDLVFP